MASSEFFEIPSDVRPEWPSRCIRCGREDPEGFYRFRSSHLHPQRCFNWLLNRARPHVNVPACPHCARMLSLRRWCERYIAWPLSFALCGFACIYAEQAGWLPQDRNARKLARICIIFVCLLPMMIWIWLRPSHVLAEADKKVCRFRFSNPSYARDFAELNKPFE